MPSSSHQNTPDTSDTSHAENCFVNSSQQSIDTDNITNQFSISQTDIVPSNTYNASNIFVNSHLAVPECDLNNIIVNDTQNTHITRNQNLNIALFFPK